MLLPGRRGVALRLFHLGYRRPWQRAFPGAMDRYDILIVTLVLIVMVFSGAVWLAFRAASTGTGTMPEWINHAIVICAVSALAAAIFALV